MPATDPTGIQVASALAQHNRAGAPRIPQTGDTTASGVQVVDRDRDELIDTLR